MQLDGLPPDSYSYSAAIGALSNVSITATAISIHYTVVTCCLLEVVCIRRLLYRIKSYLYSSSATFTCIIELCVSSVSSVTCRYILTPLN
jgi:hypothetical protein